MTDQHSNTGPVVSQRPVRRLAEGDAVAFVSPSFPPPPGRVRAARRMVEDWGLTVVDSPYRDPSWLNRPSADERAAELQWAIEDPQVHGVVAVYGGRGALATAAGVDFSGLANQPKPVCGFSDVSHVHHQIGRAVALPSFHTTHLGWVLPQLHTTCARSMREVLMGSPTSLRATGFPLVPARGPAVEGILRGGNLATLADAVTSATDTEPIVLFLEDVGESATSIVKFLRRISEVAFPGKIAGIVLGQFTHCGPRAPLMAALAEFCERTCTTVLSGLEVGHGLRSQSFALGWPVVVEPSNRRVRWIGSPTSKTVTW